MLEVLWRSSACRLVAVYDRALLGVTDGFVFLPFLDWALRHLYKLVLQQLLTQGASIESEIQRFFLIRLLCQFVRLFGLVFVR